jgi:hypothetical protein
MKRLTSLWCALATELGEQLSVHVARDIKTVTSRVETEGFSFLAITLPGFSADFESALSAGVIDPTLFRAFRKSGRAPAFLRGFLGRVFDTQSGTLLPYPDECSIFAVRQLSLFFKKMKVSCSPERVDDAYQRYVECDDEVGEVGERILNSPLFPELQRMFTTLFWRPLRKLDQLVDSYSLNPQHGPGSTADRKVGNKKWEFSTWPARFEKDNIFPFREYALSRYGLDEAAPSLTHEDDELPVRVIHVPKTLTSPRIIAMEPTCMMYMQKGVSSALESLLESDSLIGPMIGFTDQNPNREMARIGSFDGSLATLDLKEASDRVPYSVMRELVYPIAPTAWEAMDASRSRRANVQGSVRTLNKFASMGSALCFPTEAMYFLCIAFVGIRRALECARLGEDQVRSFHEQVRVYGDDIVVPTDFARSVRESLSDYGLIVNEGKSFSRGSFRESCGGEYYAGVEITPVRARHMLPTSNRDVTSLVSWTDTMNQLYFAGLWKTSESVRGELEAHLGRLPWLPTTSEGLGVHSFLPCTSGRRMSPKLQVPQVKAWIPRSKQPSVSTDGYSALRKCFAGNFYESRNAGHLEASGRASVVQLIRRWVEVSDFPV